MSTIIGQTLAYALNEATKNQTQLNQALLDKNADEQTLLIAKEQTELLHELTTLCERAF